MTLAHLRQPRARVTVTRGATPYEIQNDSTHIEVVLRENAARTCLLTVNDKDAATYNGKAQITDTVKVEFKYLDGSNTYTQVFGGYIDELRPSLQTAETVQILAYGYGIALSNMAVREEFGNQADNTLNTIKECLTDSTYGIIPKYVEKVLATATSSGYTIDTTKVADLTSDFNFLTFRGKPALHCLNDMIDLVRAANVPNAGCHWSVVPSGTTAYLCLATVGNHENPPADVWPTWWNTDQTNSTIVVKQDMVTSTFTKQRSPANYVLLTGDFERPVHEKWTENNSGSWGNDNVAATTISDDGTTNNYVVGSYSLKVVLLAPP